MNKRSSKGKALDAEYSRRRKLFLQQHPCCQARLPGCTGCREDQLTIHHKKGRGLYYLDTRYFMTACLSCHQWIETHPESAKSRGFSLDRLTP